MRRERAGDGLRGRQLPRDVGCQESSSRARTEREAAASRWRSKGGAQRRGRPLQRRRQEGDGVARKYPREQLMVRRQERTELLPRCELGEREEDVGVSRCGESGATDVDLNEVSV